MPIRIAAAAAANAAHIFDEFPYGKNLAEYVRDPRNGERVFFGA